MEQRERDHKATLKSLQQKTEALQRAQATIEEVSRARDQALLQAENASRKTVEVQRQLADQSQAIVSLQRQSQASSAAVAATSVTTNERVEQLVAENASLASERAQLVEALQRLGGEVQQVRQQHAAAVAELEQQIGSWRQHAEHAMAGVQRLESERELAVQHMRDAQRLLDEYQREQRELTELRTKQQTAEWVRETTGDEPTSGTADTDIQVLQERKILQLLQECELLQVQMHQRPSLLAQVRQQNHALELELGAARTALEHANQNAVLLVTQLGQEYGRAERLAQEVANLLHALENNSVPQLLAYRQQNELRFRVDAAIGEQTRETLAIMTPMLCPAPAAATEAENDSSSSTTAAVVPATATTLIAAGTTTAASATSPPEAAAKSSGGWFSRIPILGRLAG